MSFDGHKNFSYSTVATAPSPASSGTSLTVASGDGSKFPAVPFNATVWPASTQPTTANAEIVRVTAISTDTLTITRAQESTSARSIIVGDQIAATITSKVITDIEAATITKLFDSTLGADTATIDTGANGIASGYSGLLILLNGRTDEAGVRLSVINFTFNNDTGANYDRGFLLTSSVSTTPTGDMSAGATSLQLTTAGAAMAANVSGALQIFVPNYDGTTFYKSAVVNFGEVDTTAANANRAAGMEVLQYRSTSAISRLAVTPNNAGSKFKAGTRLTIHGLP